MGYELELDQLRRAATAARSGGDQLGEVDTNFMPAVYDVLPGSRSRKQIKTLADTWRGQVAALSGSLRGYATNVTECADRYAANEADAAKVFDQVRVGGAKEY